MNSINDDKLYSLGLEHYKKNKLDNSYDFLVKIKNKNLNTYKLISNIHIKKNDFKNAEITLNQILCLDKENLFALNSLGDLNKLEKKYNVAEKFYKKTIFYDKNFVPGYFNLASLYEDKGELKLAKDLYLKVVEIDNKNYAAYFNLQRLDDNSVTEETIIKIENEIKFNKDSHDKNIAYGHFVLAKYYRKKNKINMEIKELSKGHKIFFDSNPINKNAVDYWLEKVPKKMKKKILFYNTNKNKFKSALF